MRSLYTGLTVYIFWSRIKERKGFCYWRNCLQTTCCCSKRCKTWVTCCCKWCGSISWSIAAASCGKETCESGICGSDTAWDDTVVTTCPPTTPMLDTGITALCVEEGGPDEGSSLARLWQREMVMACGEAEVDGTASSSGGVWSGEGLRWWEASPVAGAPRRVASKLGRAADKNVLTHHSIIINLHLISSLQ